MTPSGVGETWNPPPSSHDHFCVSLQWTLSQGFLFSSPHFHYWATINESFQGAFRDFSWCGSFMGGNSLSRLAANTVSNPGGSAFNKTCHNDFISALSLKSIFQLNRFMKGRHQDFTPPDSNPGLTCHVAVLTRAITCCTTLLINICICFRSPSNRSVSNARPRHTAFTQSFCRRHELT